MPHQHKEQQSFIKKSASIPIASSLPLSLSSMSLSSKYKMGLQLFIFRDATQENPLESLKAVDIIDP